MFMIFFEAIFFLKDEREMENCWQEVNRNLHVNIVQTVKMSITYKKLPRDPTGRIFRTTNQLIKDSTTVAAEDILKLKKTETLPPRLYGLPKIHKPDVPLSMR